MVRTQARSALILLVAVVVLFVRPGTAQEKRGVPKLQRVPGELAKKVKLERIARGLSRPVAVVQPPGDDQRLFVVEQTGKIKILRQGAVLPTPFLDLSGT